MNVTVPAVSCIVLFQYLLNAFYYYYYSLWEKKATVTCKNVQNVLIEKTELWLPLATAWDYGLGMAVTVKWKIHVGLVSTGAYKMAKK